MRKKISEWTQVQEIVLSRLNELHTDIKQVREVDIPSMREQIAELKVKASLWGAVAGMVGGAIGVVISVFQK